MLNTLRRWRTWIVNAGAAVIVAMPDIMNAFVGYNWGEIIPPKYLPFVTIGLLVLNIWMRPRPAVLPTDPEAQK